MTKRRRTGQLAKHKREIEGGATNGKEELMEAMVAAAPLSPSPMETWTSESAAGCSL